MVKEGEWMSDPCEMLEELAEVAREDGVPLEEVLECYDPLYLYAKCRSLRRAVAGKLLRDAEEAVAVEELLALGAHTFIRVGTAGALRPDLAEGDLCVVTGGVRDEGTTPQYLPPEFPAVADPDVVIALRDAARALRAPHRVGITQSKDSLYGEVQPERMPVAERLLARKRAFAAGGAICSEMEASAIFILTSIHGGRAGGLMLVVGEERPRKEHVDRLVRVAVEGVRGLLRRDRESGQSRG